MHRDDMNVILLRARFWIRVYQCPVEAGEAPVSTTARIDHYELD